MTGCPARAHSRSHYDKTFNSVGCLLLRGFFHPPPNLVDDVVSADFELYDVPHHAIDGSLMSHPSSFSAIIEIARTKSCRHFHTTLGGLCCPRFPRLFATTDFSANPRRVVRLQLRETKKARARLLSCGFQRDGCTTPALRAANIRVHLQYSRQVSCTRRVHT